MPTVCLFRIFVGEWFLLEQRMYKIVRRQTDHHDDLRCRISESIPLAFLPLGPCMLRDTFRVYVWRRWLGGIQEVRNFLSL